MRNHFKQDCEVMADTSREHEQMPDCMVEWYPIQRVEHNPD